MSDPKPTIPSAAPRGFAAMAPDRQLELARKGGASVPKNKRSYSTNRQLASISGAKGGRNVAAEARSFSTNRKLAAEAGRKGGKASQAAKKEVDHGHR